MHLVKRRSIPWLLAPILGLAILAASVPAIVGAIPTPVVVSTASLPNGEVGSVYSQTLAATGGTLPYTWATSAGTLPAGLSLNTSTGAISGTPTTVGTSNFTAQVTDSVPTVSTAPLSITVNPAIAITTTTLPTGEVGSAYSQTLATSGGITAFTWSISDGSLPAGLSLNASTGVISGTPTTAGTSSFTVMVTDSVAHSASMPLSIMVNDNLAVSTASLAAGSVGAAYSETLASTGGVGPFTWTISVDTLPAGLSLVGSTGVISGTPTATGTTNFTAMVTDSLTRTAVQALSILVNPAGLAVATTSLPDGTVGTAYSQTLMATGGTAPLSWSISAGSLPAGLSLVASTGVISGTPTTAGSSAFTVMVTDNATHTATQALSITINGAGTPPPPELDNLTARVTAACQASAIAALPAGQQKVETALCDFFFNGPQLSPSVKNAVGHLILKIAGVMGKDDDVNENEHEDQNSPAALPGGDDHGNGDDRSSATVTPTPATTSTSNGGKDDRKSSTPTVTPTHTVTTNISHLSMPTQSTSKGDNKGGNKNQNH